jgi:hypothetical protein
MLPTTALIPVLHIMNFGVMACAIAARTSGLADGWAASMCSRSQSKSRVATHQYMTARLSSTETSRGSQALVLAFRRAKVGEGSRKTLPISNSACVAM